MTEFIEMEVIVANLENGKPSKDQWIEKINVPVDKDPHKYLENMIIEFNKVEDERKSINPDYPITYRVFVGIKGETGERITFCDLSGKKYNNVTLILGKDSYDILRCPKCRKFYQRLGLGQLFNYDNNKCSPDTLCKKCNKTFSSVKLLENHMKIGKHRTPKWLVTQTNLTE